MTINSTAKEKTDLTTKEKFIDTNLF